MGRPIHYSAEIAARCQRLIEGLAAQVGADENLSKDFRGPLRTTFLLAMATPMIVLPMERLYKPAIGRPGVADDTELDANIAARVRETFDGRRFGEIEFFRPKQWAFVDATDYFPVALPWPADVFAQLDRPEALAAAEQAPATVILSCLRNALSHGGVGYLDRHGRQSEDATKMLGFTSYPTIRRTEELRLLRISVDDFQEFLGHWSRWLTDTRIESLLTDDGPGWLDPVEAKPAA